MKEVYDNDELASVLSPPAASRRRRPRIRVRTRDDESREDLIEEADVDSSSMPGMKPAWRCGRQDDDGDKMKQADHGRITQASNQRRRCFARMDTRGRARYPSEKKIMASGGLYLFPAVTCKTGCKYNNQTVHPNSFFFGLACIIFQFCILQEYSS
jgi:hypothetical protein